MAGAIFADWPLFIRVLRHRIFSNYQKIFIANTTKDIYLRLDDVSPDNLDHLRFVGNSIRNYLTGITLPTEVEEAVVKTWQGLGENHAYAVLSSATAEDLPHASFAGNLSPMNSYSVSIIIPTYNRGWIVRDAIDSVLGQTDTDFELVVVDDGSTDRTPEILDSYGDRLRVIRQANQGVSAARNRGIGDSSGPLIALLDSDDIWLPGKISVQVDFFKKNPAALICQTEEIWIRNGLRVNPGKRHRKPFGMIFEPSLELCLVSPSAVMVRRELFEKVGLFDESLPACEDYDLWLRVGCRYPVHLIGKPLTIKRGGHEDQLSRQSSLDRYRIRSLVKLIESGRLSLPQCNAAVIALRKKCAVYANGCLKRGRLEEALHYTTLFRKYHL